MSNGGSGISLLPIEALRPGDSPRLGGEVEEHTRLLAESDGPLPPILVTRTDLRVVDGMHRLAAARLRSQETVEVEFFDGDTSEAFVAAVRANTSHGLPLARVDREAAVERIIATHPRLSDRAVAGITKLSARTVAGIRRRMTADGQHEPARIGRDGRVRPLSSVDARRAASEVIAEHPEASLRQVARLSGLSPATVRDVRDRMRRGDDPVPSGQRESRKPEQRAQPREDANLLAARDRMALLDSLRRDPSLRFSDSGRLLLRWLLSNAGGPEGWERVVETIPPHCAYLVVEVARGCAAEWQVFAEQLDQRLNASA